MTNLTLKNLPEELYAELKLAAERNRRSLNGEAILRLERSLRSSRHDPESLLSKIRKERSAIGATGLTDDEVRHAKRHGRT